MDCLDIFRMVVSPSPSHAFGLDVVGYDLAVIREGNQADCTFPFLVGDLSVQQLPHLSRRAEFAVPPWMVRIIDALNAKLKSPLFPILLATAAEQRSMDRTIFIPTEFHGNAPV